MSRLKYPLARGLDGIPIPPQLALPGVEYPCLTCQTGALRLKKGEKRQAHFCAIPGKENTGALCSWAAGGKGHGSVGVIDAKRMIANCMRPKRGPVDPPEKPGSPHKSTERRYINSNLDDIRDNKMKEVDDFELDDGSRLTDYYVSERNIRCILGDNNAIGPRAVAVNCLYSIDRLWPIRCYMQGHKGWYGKSIAARMVLDLVGDDQETYIQARNRLYVWHKDPSTPKMRLMPRYSSVLVFGIFESVPRCNCREYDACTVDCTRTYIHCVGRQKSRLVNPDRQIYVDDADLIDYGD